MTKSARSLNSAPRSEKTVAEFFTISEISRTYGVSTRALRFYEERGLLNPIRKKNLRLYDPVQTARLQTILKGKELGFTLTEIIGLLDANSSCGRPALELALNKELLLSQLGHLEKRRSALDQAIAGLRAAHKRLVAAEPDEMEGLGANPGVNSGDD